MSDPTQRAIKLCQAHNFAIQTPTLVGVNHNHFQAFSTSDTYGIIPTAAGNNLAGLDASPEGLAYEAMSPAQWGQDSSNYCCINADVGCYGHSPVPGAGQIAGNLDNVTATGGGAYSVNGWACAKIILLPWAFSSTSMDFQVLELS